MKNASFFKSVSILLLLFICTGVFAQNEHADIARDVLSQTNQFRKSNGLDDLELRDELNSLAQKHSENMASGRIKLGHSGFAKRNAMAVSAIKSIHSFAENVAYGATSANEVVALWKSSSGHRRNMLGHYSFTGIGIAKDKHGRIYYTQIFAG